MKKILIALMFITFVCCHAYAQKTVKAGKTVASKAQTAPVKKKHKMHKPEPVQDFAICRNNYGYYICNEAPASGNSTHSRIVIKEERPAPPMGHYIASDDLNHTAKDDLIAPPSQSYPENTNTVSGICDYPYSKPHYIVLGPFKN